jgi:hypothetical protein
MRRCIHLLAIEYIQGLHHVWRTKMVKDEIKCSVIRKVGHTRVNEERGIIVRNRCMDDVIADARAGLETAG